MIESLWSLGGFVVAVCILVTVHEFGHYWVARRLGFKVLRFSVGFGRALWTRLGGVDRTEYVLAAVPLGGYVKLLDEREAPVAPEDLPRSFTRRPHWQRIAVLLAGPARQFPVCDSAADGHVAGVRQHRAAPDVGHCARRTRPRRAPACARAMRSWA